MFFLLLRWVIDYNLQLPTLPRRRCRKILDLPRFIKLVAGARSDAAREQKMQDTTMRAERDKDVIVPVETDTLLKNNAKPTFLHDAIDILHLSGPIFLAMLSWLGMKTTDTALLGHVGADALAAAALSDLWTMCSAVLIQGRVLGILVGGAVGAGNPKLAGIYLQVSYVVLSIIAVFVIVAWNVTEKVWVSFGSDPDISREAGYYARVLSLSIPGLVLFGQVTQFFSAQRILKPEVHSSLIALGVNLIFGLIFVLGIGVPNFSGYGFRACPIVTTLVAYLQITVFYVVYIHIQRLHEPCWGGWKWKEITRERIITFSKLYFPSALGSASDFWRVAVIGAIAANLGEEEVAVFNTSYRIMWIVLTMVNAMSMAAGINMSMRLGKLDAMGARQAGYVGATMSLVFLLLVFGAVAGNIRAFGMIFTQDENFLNLFEETRWPFTITLVLMNLSVGIERIPYSMGRTTEVFWMGCIASWGAQVPAVLFLTTYWRDDLIGLYWGMAIGYFVLLVLYSGIAFTSDWEKYARIAYERAESSDVPALINKK